MDSISILNEARYGFIVVHYKHNGCRPIAMMIPASLLRAAIERRQRRN